jgi:hypothetical protein
MCIILYREKEQIVSTNRLPTQNHSVKRIAILKAYSLEISV